MPFPLSKFGSFRVETSGPAEQNILALEAALFDWLADKKARRITRSDLGVNFTAGMFRLVMNWNILVPVSSGEIRLAPQGGGIEISYHLRFTEMFVIVTGAVILLMGPDLMSAPNLNAVEVAGLLLSAWLWLFGANYLVAIFRFPNALKQLACKTTGGSLV